MSRTQGLQSKRSAALDAAGLAAGSIATAELNAGDSVSQVQGDAQLAAQNIHRELSQRLYGINTFYIGNAQLDAADSVLTVTAQTSLPTTILGAVGENAIPVAVYTKIKLGTPPPAQCGIVGPHRNKCAVRQYWNLWLAHLLDLLMERISTALCQIRTPAEIAVLAGNALPAGAVATRYVSPAARYAARSREPASVVGNLSMCQSRTPPPLLFHKLRTKTESL